MKKLLLLFLGIFCIQEIVAQELTMKSFLADPSDLSAAKYEVKDYSGTPCALLKIGLVLSDVIFEGDIVKSEYREGEWWVYFSEGASWLTVKSDKYLPLRCEFEPLEKKQTYLMLIELPAGGKVPTGKMTISCNVKDADVYVDGEKTSSILPFTYEGREGEHRVEIRANGYNTETVPFTIQLNRRGSMTVTLKTAGSFSVNGISYEMVRMDAGQFKMGSAKKVKTGSFNYAQPAHTVTLRAFKIGKTEVSQALWKEIMGNNPSINQGPDLPVENVSWYDAMEFIEKLNERCGTHFRLPTEAEWEYAARSGGISDPDEIAGNGAFDRHVSRGNTTSPVGIRLPNQAGIHDMSGNVAEWCSDWLAKYTPGAQSNPAGPEKGIRKIIRGGAFNDDTTSMECATRGHAKPDTMSPAIGFRLALDD